MRPSAHDGEIEAATHRVQAHATETERQDVARAVMEWEDTFAGIGEDLPPRLLPAIVAQALAASEGVVAA